MTNWKEQFKSTQYNKLAFIGSGAEKWIEQHNKAIETEIIEKLIDDAVNGPHNETLLREELRDKWL